MCSLRYIAKKNKNFFCEILKDKKLSNVKFVFLSIEIKKLFPKEVNRIFFIENFWDMEKEILRTFSSFFDKILDLVFTDNSFFSQFIDYG